MATNDDRIDATRLPRTEAKHPAEWQRDLNPAHLGGQNVGETSVETERGLPTAYDVKAVHRTLNCRSENDEPLQTPALPRGRRLQQGGRYLDIRDPGHAEFTPRGSMEADGEHRYVPKDAVPFSLWNRLTGVKNPERIAGRRDDRHDR